MSDIVEHWRNPPKEMRDALHGNPELHAWGERAADEIERLREALKNCDAKWKAAIRETLEARHAQRNQNPQDL